MFSVFCFKLIKWLINSKKKGKEKKKLPIIFLPVDSFHSSKQLVGRNIRIFFRCCLCVQTEAIVVEVNVHVLFCVYTVAPQTRLPVHYSTAVQ